MTSDPVRSEGRAGPSGWAQSPGLESPGWGSSWSIMWGTPGGTARPRTPLGLDEGPGAREAAPTALPPGRRRAPLELDGRRRCAASRPRRGRARKAAGSVVCCEVRLLFKWRGPRLGLLMGADHAGFSLPVPAFFWGKQIVNPSQAQNLRCRWEQASPPPPRHPLSPASFASAREPEVREVLWSQGP